MANRHPRKLRDSWTWSRSQRRRCVMDDIIDAIHRNDHEWLQQLLSDEQPIGRSELTSSLRHVLQKKSDSYAHVVQLLLQRGADPNAADGKGVPFLHMAVESNSVLIVRSLIAANCDVNRPRLDGAVALHCAARRNHVTCTGLLLDAGACTDKMDAHGRSALLVASQANNVDVVMALLSYDCNVQTVDSCGHSAVYWAVVHGHDSVLRLLLTKGATVDVPDEQKCTPLMVAAQKGDTECASVCIEAGADVNAENSLGETPLLLASNHGHVQCARHLVRAGADVNVVDCDNLTPLMHLIHDSDSVAELLKAGADPDEPCKSISSPLGFAVANCYVRSSRLLLQANCDPGGDCGKRPLQVALYRGHMVLVKIIFIASIANEKAHAHLRWLRGYLRDENFERRASDVSSVLEAKLWLVRAISEQWDNPCSLLQLSRRCVRKLIGRRQYVERTESLPLPSIMKNYLLMSEIMSIDS